MARAAAKYDIISIGSAVRDIFLFLREEDVLVFPNPRREETRRELLALEYGAKVAVAKSAQSLGGGALNCAVTFGRLGLATAAIVSLGCDEAAEAVVADMRRENVGTGFVNYHSSRPTGFSALLVGGAEREHIAIVERGANDLLDLSAGKRDIRSAKWYYTTTLSGPHWTATLDKIVSVVANKKISWAWNPGGEQLEQGVGALGRWLKHCAVFLVNRDGALGLLSSGNDSGRRRHDIKFLLSSLLSWGAKAVIITDGPDGAYYGDEKQILFVPAGNRVQVTDSTGAGDAFGSGFVAGLLLTKGQNIHWALSLAMANAEAVIQKVGAQEGILRKREAEKAVKRIKNRIKKIK